MGNQNQNHSAGDRDELARHTEEVPLGLLSLLDRYREHETRCEILNDVQDSIARRYSRSYSECADFRRGPPPEECMERFRNSARRVYGFEDFRRRHYIASNVMMNSSTTRKFVFARALKSSDLDGIDEIQEQISAEKIAMQKLEQEVYDFSPRNVDEIAAKLTFVTRQMLDGVDMDVSFFVYLVEECTNLLQESIQMNKVQG